MNITPKTKVIFDTSFLIRSYENVKNENGCNIIDAEFPSNNWDRIIHDYVIDEFFRIEDKRLERADFYERNKIYIMRSSHKLILDEFEHGTAQSSLEKNETFESNIIPFLKKQHWDQVKIENEHNKKKEQRDLAKKVFYELIGKDINNTSITLQQLKDDIQKIINSGHHIPLPFEENITIYMRENSFERIYILGTKDILKKEIFNIANDLPTLYQFMLLEQLIKKLEKPEKKNEFKAFLPGLKSHVKIEFNTFADSQISLSGLHYCDAFATFDKGQAQIIKFLFPQYANKVEFYQINKDKKTYKHIKIENL